MGAKARAMSPPVTLFVWSFPSKLPEKYRWLSCSHTMTPFRERTVSHTAKTWCYRNLHRGGYSMVQDGLVVAHADVTTLVGVTFVVRESGRQRVLSEGVKNVHAFVVGRVPEMVLCPTDLVWRKARYNPKRAAYFEAEVDGEWIPMESADAVTMGPTGVTVYNPRFLKIQDQSGAVAA